MFFIKAIKSGSYVFVQICFGHDLTLSNKYNYIVTFLKYIWLLYMIIHVLCMVYVAIDYSNSL